MALHGIPPYYTPDSSPAPSRPCFQQRFVHQVRAPQTWTHARRLWQHAGALGWSEWYKVELDSSTDTMVALSSQGVLLLRHVSYLTHSLIPPSLCLYAFPQQRPASAASTMPGPYQPMSPQHLPRDWMRALQLHGMGSPSVCQGRVLVVHGLCTLLDLRVPSSLSKQPVPDIYARVSRPGVCVPFTVYEWSEMIWTDSTSASAWPIPQNYAIQMDQVGTKCISHADVHLLRSPPKAGGAA